MNIEETKLAVSIMQAYVDGSEIEWHVKNSSQQWRVTVEPRWTWSEHDYRVANKKLSEEERIRRIVREEMAMASLEKLKEG